MILQPFVVNLQTRRLAFLTPMALYQFHLENYYMLLNFGKFLQDIIFEKQKISEGIGL
jgi:hypothetical protein